MYVTIPASRRPGWREHEPRSQLQNRATASAGILELARLEAELEQSKRSAAAKMMRILKDVIDGLFTEYSGLERLTIERGISSSDGLLVFPDGDLEPRQFADIRATVQQSIGSAVREQAVGEWVRKPGVSSVIRIASQDSSIGNNVDGYA